MADMLVNIALGIEHRKGGRCGTGELYLSLWIQDFKMVKIRVRGYWKSFPNKICHYVVWVIISTTIMN